jgi:hypothetical protein
MRVLGCGDMKGKIEGVCFERAAVSRCPLEMDDVCPLRPSPLPTVGVQERIAAASLFTLNRSASTKAKFGGTGAAFFRVGRRQGLLACLT